jgi:predicted ATPase/DNA-binding SARP family transcriptional activator
MAGLNVYLFGAPHVERDRVPVKFARRKVLALLAYLAVTDQAHQRDALAVLLWPELDRQMGRADLSRTLHGLRQALGAPPSGEDWLEVSQEQISLRSGPDLHVDVADFRRLLAQVMAHEHLPGRLCADCLAALTRAVELYQGDFLAGFTLDDSAEFDDWQTYQSEELRRKLAEALEQLFLAHGQREEYNLALAVARRWVALDPLVETAQRALMQAYAWSGDRAAALRQYAECEQILRKELDCAPEVETQTLYERIKQHLFPVRGPATTQQDNHLTGFLPLSERERGSAPSPLWGVGLDEGRTSETSQPPNNLAAPLAPLVGRTREREHIRGLLRNPHVRLVTLTGTGGVGKTRLSEEIAANLLSEFPDGVYFVSLASTREPEGVPSAIAQALGVHETTMPPLETLKIGLRAKALLLVLDNFEHVASAAPIVTDLLRACPRLKVLVTSREALRLSGEHVFVVPPLALPRLTGATPAVALTESDAVELFRQRAAAARHDFVLDDITGPAVAEVCVSLDGLPLAIELAAARVRHFSPQAIVRLLRQDSLSDNVPLPALQLLAADARDVPLRHRSIRDTIAWSYTLLDAEEQTLFRRLAFFVGGWTVEAAEAVCGQGQSFDIATSLLSLVDKNLAQRAGDGGAPRFTMLETLREFALEQLRRTDEWPDIQRRMATYYVRLVEEAQPRMYSLGSAEISKALRLEHANLRVVIRWALAQREVDICLRLCAALYPFWSSYPQEGLQAALATLEIAEGSPPSLLYARTLACAGYFSLLRDHIEAAHHLMTRSLAMREAIGHVNDLVYPSVVLGILAWTEFHRGNYVQAQAYHREQLAHERQTGNEWAQAMTLVNIGNMSAMLGDFDQAEQLTDEALRLHRRVGQVWGIAKTLSDQGGLYIRLGRFEGARRALVESLVLCEQNQVMDIAGNVKSNLGLLALRQGNYQQAATLFREALSLGQTLGIANHMVETVEQVAELALDMARPSHALCLAGAAAALRVESGRLAPPLEKAAFDDMICKAREKLDEETAHAAWVKGQVMTLNGAVDYALKTALNEQISDECE